MFVRAVLSGLLLAAPVADAGTGACQVVVRQANVAYSQANVAYGGHVAAAPVQISYNTGYAQQAFGHTIYDPYASQAIFAYKVRDEEKEALIRSNERALKALAETVESQNRRLDLLKGTEAGTGEVVEETPQPLKGIGAEDSPPVKLLKTECLSCHSGAKAKAGFDMTFPMSPTDKILVNDYVQTGEMPKGKPFNDEQKALVKKWAEVNRAELRRARLPAKTPPPPPAPAKEEAAK
jgi:hypothetical protein